MTVRLIQADMRHALADLPSVDAIVTDPPYGLGFMGKGWDHGVPGVDFWSATLRVLKPGGHLLAFGGTRTYHRLAVAIEDAGFEIRDCLSWMYGQGFPKSLDVSKAIDKAAGATPEAEQWQGWGTALKPAWEPIVVARKPLIGTVAANVLAHGTGALNVDGTRIGTSDPPHACRRTTALGRMNDDGWQPRVQNYEPAPAGRWPANVMLTHHEDCTDDCHPDCPVRLLDEQTGITKSEQPRVDRGVGGMWSPGNGIPAGPQYGDSGGASRFFYCAKASKRERNAGLPDGMTNTHPTCKPVEVMAWLCRLVTPPNGTILDPFMGSGSTGVAAVREGFHFVGIDLDPEYVEIARHRIPLLLSCGHPDTQPDVWHTHPDTHQPVCHQCCTHPHCKDQQ